MTERLYQEYKDNIAKKLQSKFKYKNVMEIPKIDKVVINMGMGEAVKDAKKIEGAGAFSIVLECIEKKTAQKITECLKIPTIGIGSSNMCDGQILVTDDMLGLSGFYPKFVKKYANLQKTIDKAIKQFDKEVKLNKFPLGKNSF